MYCKLASQWAEMTFKYTDNDLHHCHKCSVGLYSWLCSTAQLIYFVTFFFSHFSPHAVFLVIWYLFFFICFISLQSNSALAAGLSRRSSSLCQQCSCSLNCDISFFLGSLPSAFSFFTCIYKVKVGWACFLFFFQGHLHSYYSYSPDSYPVKSAFKCYSSSAVRTEFNVYPGHFCNDFIHFTRRSFWK